MRLDAIKDAKKIDDIISSKSAFMGFRHYPNDAKTIEIKHKKISTGVKINKELFKIL